jgi:hypothetical protein
MLRSFFGKGKKSEGSSTSGAADARGLQVVEDDPDTTWGLWEDAVADQDSRFSTSHVPQPLPDTSGAFLHTVPLPIREEGASDDPALVRDRTVEQLKEEALLTVELHHHRIANTIRTLWGHKECSEYISKLILDGGDSKGHARMGFNQEAAASMMVLSDIHDELFGDMRPSSGTGYADFTTRSGLDGSR